MAYKLILADTDEREIHDETPGKQLKVALKDLGLKVNPIYVSVNSKRKRFWKTYAPVDGDIIFCFFEEKHRDGVGDFIVGALFAAAGVATLIFSAGIVGIAFGIGLLGIGIGLLTADSPSTGNANYGRRNSDSLKDVSGTDMQINPGSKIPLQFGGTWYRPDLLCAPFEYNYGGGGLGRGKETVGNFIVIQGGIGAAIRVGDNYVFSRQSCCIGYQSDVANVDASMIYVVDQPLWSLPSAYVGNGLAWESCLSKSCSVSITPQFDSTSAIGIIAAIGDGTYTAAIEIEVWVQGQWSYNSEEYQEETARIEIDFTVWYQNGGSAYEVVRVEACRKDSFFYTIYLNAPGANKIQLHNARCRWGPFRDSIIVGNFVFRQVRFIQYGGTTQRPILKNPEVKAVSIQYSNQYHVDSSSMKVLALCRAIWRRCTDLATYTCASGKGNPADAILYAATNKHSLGANALTDAQVDMEALRTFWNYCDKRNYNFVTSVTDARSFQDLVMHIALVGHSRMGYNKQGQLTIITDDTYDNNYDSIPAPVVCLINGSNTIKDSWKVTKSNIDYSQKPTVLRINFVDHNTRQESVGYVFLDARRYYNSDMTKKSFDQVVNSIDYTKDIVTTLDIDAYEGIRNPYQVYEMGRRQILKQYYTTTEVTFTMGIQANGLAMWDRVWLGHTLLANSIVSGKIIGKSVSGNVVTLRLDRAILFGVPSTLDDTQLRSIDAPRSQIVINHIDLNDGNKSFNRSYAMTASPDNQFTVSVEVENDDPLKTVEIGEYDIYSIANGYFDGVIVSRKPKDDKMTELTVTDYLFDPTCTPTNPFTTYETAARLKYGNPYWTYKEAQSILPHFWANSTQNNP